MIYMTQIGQQCAGKRLVQAKTYRKFCMQLSTQPIKGLLSRFCRLDDGADILRPALNPDLWDVLLGLTMKHEVHYHWVKGHATNPKNNRCDELAVAEWKKLK